MIRGRARLNTKAELLEYWRAHPHLELQQHHGVSFNFWWWLRDGDDGETVEVHGTAANAVTNRNAKKPLTEYVREPIHVTMKRRCTSWRLLP